MKEYISSPNRLKHLKVIAGSALAGVALAGCSVAEAKMSYEKTPIEITDGFIDGFIREEPVRVEQADFSNSCARPETPLMFKAQEAYVARDTDANGDWIGFEIDKLGADICKGDEDGIVWVNLKQGVAADYTEVAVPAH